MNLPEEADWFVWRLITHERMNVTLAELEDRWSLDDAQDAHEILDELDRIAMRAMEKAKSR